MGTFMKWIDVASDVHLFNHSFYLYVFYKKYRSKVSKNTF